MNPDLQTPGRDESPLGAEIALRAEIETLRRQLDEQKNRAKEPSPAHPSAGKLAALGTLLIVLIVAGFFVGYLPHQRRESVLAAEAKTGEQALPAVNVVAVERSSGKSQLVLPGNVQAVSEAPVMARASGYVKRRYVDIGDRVNEGQLLADIEAPELDQQIRQAMAAREQAAAALQQTEANLQQVKTNENLARITAQRWSNLAGRGVVSKQENDTYQAQYEAQQANVHAVEKSVAAARSNVAVAEAGLARFRDLKDYQQVRAPFAGVVTLRNVDTGMLISEGSTLLFRIAQPSRLRIYVNVPQGGAGSVRVGQSAAVTLQDMGGPPLAGTVTRTANALDPTTRTLLTEVQLANPSGKVMPGMYALVDLATPRQDPPLLVPGDTLIVRSDGPQVAVVDAEDRVHIQRVKLGRDFGEKVEVTAGLTEGARVVVNPGDSVRNGVKVKAVLLPGKAPAGTAPAAGGGRG